MLRARSHAAQRNPQAARSRMGEDAVPNAVTSSAARSNETTRKVTALNVNRDRWIRPSLWTLTSSWFTRETET